MLSHDAVGEAGPSLHSRGAAGFQGAERGPVVGSSWDNTGDRHKDGESTVTLAWDTSPQEKNLHPALVSVTV